MTLDRPNNECVIPDNVNAKESSLLDFVKRRKTIS